MVLQDGFVAAAIDGRLRAWRGDIQRATMSGPRGPRNSSIKNAPVAHASDRDGCEWGTSADRQAPQCIVIAPNASHVFSELSLQIDTPLYADCTMQRFTFETKHLRERMRPAAPRVPTWH